jgi:DNA-binding NarL/FixJ family response regulator
MTTPSGFGNLPRLTQREVEVLRFLERGLPDTEIAKALSISPSTVVNHTRNIVEKLRIRLQLLAS